MSAKLLSGMINPKLPFKYRNFSEVKNYDASKHRDITSTFKTGDMYQISDSPNHTLKKLPLKSKRLILKYKCN